MKGKIKKNRTLFSYKKKCLVYESKIEDSAITLALSETFLSIEKFQNDIDNYKKVSKKQLNDILKIIFFLLKRLTLL
jgi:hypothetical protein